MRTFLSLDLAVIGCKVSYRSVQVVKEVFDNLRPSLNISTDITVKNFSPTEARSYLLANSPRFCVLIVDAATVQDAYEKLPIRREEYDILLTTAANSVGKTVSPLLKNKKSTKLPFCLWRHVDEAQSGGSCVIP